MSEDRIDPFWEFYYETGIDPTGGEMDTGEEELIEDEEEFISQLNQGKDPWKDKGLSDAEACAAIAMKTMRLADLW